MTQRSVVIIKVLIWAGCLVPLGLLVVQAFGYAGGLGANDVETILNVCGKTALNLLLLTLCVTPIRRSTGINKLVVSLVAGFLAGLWWLDALIRRRHGGFRVY